MHRSIVFGLLLSLLTIQRTAADTYSCDSNAVCGCSRNPVTETRIVGGQEAGVATWSWTVSLSIADIELCGGAILSESWIITAAHCLQKYVGQSITVYAGSKYRWSGTQNRTVSRTILHPKFNSTTFTDDIALLQLSVPLDLSKDNVRTICMPNVTPETLAAGEWPAVGQSVFVVGWGRLYEGGPVAESLQQVELQTIAYNESTCRVLISNQTVQMCASVPGGAKDACAGDSGGPLMMYFQSTKQWVLVGLVSSGRGCARPQFAGIYTRVAAYKDWIGSFTNASHSVDMNSHADTIFSSARFLLSFVSLFFLIIFRQ